MASDSVLLQIDRRGVARVTLNRPDRHNAFDDTVIAELHAAFDVLAARNDVRVAVLAAAGPSFSAGADLAWMQRAALLDRAGNLADARRLAAMLARLDGLAVPVIARVHGPAFGGAVGLVACCDIAIASRRASFSLSEVKLGLVPATVGPYVIRAIGERAARRYFITGERFDAARARSFGLVGEVVDDDAIDTAVGHCVAAILDNGPRAVRVAGQLVRDLAGRVPDAALIEHTCGLIADLRVSDEGQEGLRAFLQKRAPRWRPSGGGDET